jgi:leucyl-tRNA synthetase
MILGSNGLKMGKRYPEFAVDPMDVANTYGADTLRLYEMFMGPIEAEKPWSEEGVNGAKKFIDKFYRMFVEESKIQDKDNPNLDKIYNQTVKKVTEDYEKLSFNTAISQLMIFLNAVQKEEIFPKKYAEGFIKLLNPIAPFVTEEIWSNFGYKESISYEEWPTFDESKLVESTFEMVVQVNGKVRGKIEIDSNTTEEEMKEKAKKVENVKNYLEGNEIVKEIVIPKKLVSFVVK